MDLKITTLGGKDAGKVKLSEEIFGLDPREDILQRVVRWQLAKKQQGTHKAKGRAEIARTGAKMYKQKGTGRARHSSARVPQFRGGGKAHGPVVRDHSHDLPKKVRALGLKHALSAKAKSSSRPPAATTNSAHAFLISKPKTRRAPLPTCLPIWNREARWTGSSAAMSGSERPRWRCAPRLWR